MAAATSVTEVTGANFVADSYSKVFRVSGTLDAGNLIDAAGETDTFTVTSGSVALGDHVISYGCSVDLAGVSVTAYVSATGVVSVRLQNESGSTVDLASATWKFVVGRPSF